MKKRKFHNKPPQKVDFFKTIVSDDGSKQKKFLSNKKVLLATFIPFKVYLCWL